MVEAEKCTDALRRRVEGFAQMADEGEDQWTLWTVARLIRNDIDRCIAHAANVRQENRVVPQVTMEFRDGK